MAPSYGPKCPNHLITLVDLPFPLPKKGTGKCPESNESFDFEIEIDEHETVIDKFGNPKKKEKWAVTGNE